MCTPVIAIGCGRLTVGAAATTENEPVIRPPDESRITQEKLEGPSVALAAV